MPGSRTSMPNTALPSTLAGVSRRLSGVADQVELGGILQRDARRAGQPWRRPRSGCRSSTARPFAGLMTKLFSARHEARSTLHFCGGGFISISRAVAPAWRSDSQELRMLCASHHALVAAVCGIDARKLGADLLPIALQLFGQQHGKRGDGALPHLGLVDVERDRIVRAHVDEGVQLREAPAASAAGQRGTAPAGRRRQPRPARQKARGDSWQRRSSHTSRGALATRAAR